MRPESSHSSLAEDCGKTARVMAAWRRWMVIWISCLQRQEATRLGFPYPARRSQAGSKPQRPRCRWMGTPFHCPDQRAERNVSSGQLWYHSPVVP